MAAQELPTALKRALLNANTLGYCIRPTDTKRFAVWRMSPIGWIADSLFSAAEDAEDYLVGKLTQKDR